MTRQPRLCHTMTVHADCAVPHNQRCSRKSPGCSDDVTPAYCCPAHKHLPASPGCAACSTLRRLTIQFCGEVPSRRCQARSCAPRCLPSLSASQTPHLCRRESQRSRRAACDLGPPQRRWRQRHCTAIRPRQRPGSREAAVPPAGGRPQPRRRIPAGAHSCACGMCREGMVCARKHADVAAERFR